MCKCICDRYQHIDRVKKQTNKRKDWIILPPQLPWDQFCFSHRVLKIYGMIEARTTSGACSCCTKFVVILKVLHMVNNCIGSNTQCTAVHGLGKKRNWKGSNGLFYHHGSHETSFASHTELCKTHGMIEAETTSEAAELLQTVGCQCLTFTQFCLGLVWQLVDSLRLLGWGWPL